jgi:CBS domain-containing protein
MPTPALINEATVAFLRHHAPFSGMTTADLEFISERVRLAYFPVGSLIIDPASGVRVRDLHILQRGHVRNYNASVQGDDIVLGPGECFPVASLSANSVNTRHFVAAEDVFCFQLAKEDFEELRTRSAPFARFCTQALASIVQQSLAQLRTQFSQRAAEQQTLLQPLKALVRRSPVYCSSDTSIREALDAMSREHVGTIAVVDAAQKPLGIFTLTDLMERVVLPGVALERPIADVMTAGPGVLDELANAQEALAVMAQRGYHQLVVTRDSRIAGIVSERDLFSLQRVSMRNVMQSIKTARSVAELKRAAQDIGMLSENLIAQGAAAEGLTHTIAALNDAMTERVFDLLLPSADLAGLEWCWLSLGSEGRREQTIATDQDNAIVFEGDEDDLAHDRARLLTFARSVNEALAELGFPLCPGNIMASNRECCLSVDEWRAKFAGWVREPTPAALLNANIFFDFRPLFGNATLAERLRSWLLGITHDNRFFLRMMTANALQAEPPLGLIRTFRTDEGENQGTIDLKTQGTRIFVDAARALALGLGTPETNTGQRLWSTARRLNVPERHVAAVIDAFQFLQMMRLRAQRGEFIDPTDERAGDPARNRNRVDPYALNELDQRMLKESFRQARELQRRLQQTFGQ